MPVNKNQQQQILQGGISLVLRQLLGTGLSIVSFFVIARTLGPEQYGIVASALGIFYFIVWSNKFGLSTYLVRQPDLPKEAPEHILAVFNTVGVGFCVLLWLGAPLIGWWTKQPEMINVVRWLVLPIWLEMVATISFCMLDRELRFAEGGFIQMIAQIANFLLAIPLVLLWHWGYWGPIAGIILENAVLAILSAHYQPIRWRWRWRWSVVQPALRYGFTYAGSEAIGCLKALTIPMIVTPLAGLQAAGIISIAIRFVDQLSVMRYVLRRMSLGIMAKLMGNPAEAIVAINRGIAYQALLMGLVCATFSCLSAWLIPLLFGAKWLNSVQLFPLIALATTISTIFDLHASTLYAAGHNRAVIRFNTCHVGLFWLAIWLLLPRLGVWGYGLAELISLVSFFLLHQSLRQFCGSPNYRVATWLILASVPALLAGPWLQGWSLGLLVGSYGLLFLLRPEVRKIPQELWGIVRYRSVA
jgi:O-antigen/teichoic acid export membrane protein